MRQHVRPDLAQQDRPGEASLSRKILHDHRLARIAAAVPVAVDGEQRLLEGARRSDEWIRIRRWIPTRRMILARATPPSEGSEGDPATAGDERAVWSALAPARPPPLMTARAALPPAAQGLELNRTNQR